MSSYPIFELTAWIDERHLPPLHLTNAWGYNPVAFMAPDARYAVSDPVVEFKTMVRALHEAGKVSNTRKTIFDGTSVTTFAAGTPALYDWLDGNRDVKPENCGGCNNDCNNRGACERCTGHAGEGDPDGTSGHGGDAGGDGEGAAPLFP